MAIRTARLARLALALAVILPTAAGRPGAQPAPAVTEVDLALVLAVDVSLSMDPEEQELQREGFVEAFRAEPVHEAIRTGGLLGRIAVTYLEWAGADNQHVVVPWTVIEGADKARAFADRLSRTPPRRGAWTSVSDAIDASVVLLDESGVEALRRVIDVSGDGPNNHGRPVVPARDEAVARGITINGLPIMLKRPTTQWDVEDLDLYFRDCVIGGVGAFMVPVRSRDQFAEAIRSKLVREIAAPSATPEPLLRPAQSEARANCLVGEQRRQRRRDY